MAQSERYKTGKKAGQLRPVKTPKPRRYAQEENYILSCIDGEAYGIALNTDSEKLQFLYDTFKSEYGWAIAQLGEFNALREWLMGLPSSCSIAFYNHDILELAVEWGRLPPIAAALMPKKTTAERRKAEAAERAEDKILENYWAFMAMRILGLWQRHKTNKDSAA